MAIGEPKALLRDGLLDGVRVLLAAAPGSPEAGFGAAVGPLCERLGGEVEAYEPSLSGAPEEREALTEEAVAGILERLGGASVLIVDGAGIYEREPGPEGLAGALQGTWEVTRAVGNRAFIPAGAGGRILLVAPRSGGEDVHAAGAAAGFENLARTLSIEWARYGITVVALAPGTDTPSDEVAALCAWLSSKAGAYFSGCLLDLRGPRAAGG